MEALLDFPISIFFTDLGMFEQKDVTPRFIRSISSAAMAKASWSIT